MKDILEKVGIASYLAVVVHCDLNLRSFLRELGLRPSLTLKDLSGGTIPNQMTAQVFVAYCVITIICQQRMS